MKMFDSNNILLIGAPLPEHCTLCSVFLITKSIYLKIITNCCLVRQFHLVHFINQY